MALRIKTVLLGNAPLKVFSLILGYALWYIIGNAMSTTASLNVPLSFYNVPENTKVNAPESITIQIRGKRSLLRALDTDRLAIHINAQELNEETNSITLTNNMLLLPETINLVHYSPSNIVVERSLSLEMETA